MNFREQHALREIEFQALIVRDVVMLVVQIGNQFSVGYVPRSDVVVHLFQRGTQQVGLYRQMLRTQRISRVSGVKRRRI